jgi:hypothetical protein
MSSDKDRRGLQDRVGLLKWSGGFSQMMSVTLEKSDRNLKRNSILIGGAVAGAIAIFCALAFATKIKRSEKRK